MRAAAKRCQIGISAFSFTALYWRLIHSLVGGQLNFIVKRLLAYLMIEFELHRVDVMPDREQALSDIPRVVGFLITRLLTPSQALLHAEARRAGSEVTWYVRQRGEADEREDALAGDLSRGIFSSVLAGESEDVPVANLPAGIFSSIVARLAILFGIDHITGGCGQGTILFEGRRFNCYVFLSKCAASGYWIRLYTTGE